jgi:hemolysin activation/secretion protein
VVKKNLAVALIITTALIPLGTLAANERQQPGVIDRALPDFAIPKSHSLDSEKGSPLKEAPQKDAYDNGGEKVAKINSIAFTGVSVLPEHELQDLVREYKGRELTKNDIASIKYAVTKRFYDKGFILVKATTPPQDLSDGVLEVKIYEATIGNINIQDNGLVHPAILQGMSKQIKKLSVFNERSVESMIADINDLQGVTASVILKPGAEFGTTDLNIVLEEANEDQNFARVDNYGHEDTGRVVATAHVEKGNLFGLGEKLDLTVRASEDSLRSFSIGAQVPTGYSNILFETDYLYSENDIDGTLQSGETHIINTAFSTKLINTRTDTANLRVGFEARSHESEIAGFTAANSEDDVREVYVSASYLHRGTKSVWYSSAKLAKGIDVFGASTKGEITASRTANGGGDPEAVTFEPVFVANIRPIPEGIIKLVASGQLASNVLLSSDLFILGGYGSIRGFQPAQEAGESGWQFSAEYAHDIEVHEDWDVAFGPFLDGGAVYNRINGATQDSHLYSAGLGLEATTELIPTGDTSFRLDWAHPLGNYSSREVDDNTFYFRINQNF